MRNVIPIAVAAVILLITGAGQAQELGGLAGSIVDAETGEPLAFVNVSVRGTVSGGISGRDGNFYIPNIRAGTHEVAVSMMGYETAVRMVTIRPDRTVEMDFELKEGVIAMGEVVVTATRTPRYLKDVPIRTEVVTRQSFKDAGAGDIYEALEGVAGVRVEQQCQFCNFSQVRMQGLGADHTQILVDGQPVYSGLASVYGLQQMGTTSIERIEVVKGAGSALYGSGAIAGAINLVTRIPAARPEAGISIEFGEHESRRYDFSASQRFGNVGLVLFAQKNSGDVIDETGDGIGRESVYTPDHVSDRVRTDLTNGGFNAIVSDVFGMDQFVIRGRALHELRQGGELYNDDYDVPEDVYENPFTPGTERIVTDRHEFEMSAKKRFDRGSDVGVSVSYAHHDRNATNDTFITDYESVNGEQAPIDLLRPYLASEDLYTANINYSHPVGGKHRLLLGGQFAHNQLEESGMYVVIDEEDENYGEAYRSTSEKHSTDFGLYLQDEFAPSNALEFVLGVRYDRHDSEDKFRGSGSVAPQGVPTVEYSESSVNPRAAVRFSPTPGLAFRASVGTGFRVPYGFSEDLHLCSGSPRVWKGGDLEPEKSVSYSISADYYATRYTIGLSLYRTDVRGKIGLVDASEAASAQGYDYEWENIDDAFVQGLELSGRYEVTRSLVIDGHATFASGEYENVREDWMGTEYESNSIHVSRLPRYSTGLKAEYRPVGWSAVVDADLQGPLYIDYYADGDEPTKIKETETYVIVNARVSKHLTEDLSLFVGGRNLTDYVQEEKHTDDAAFMYAPVYGRIFYGGVAIDF